MCRAEVRNDIGIGDIAVFFAFTETESGNGKKVTYRLSARCDRRTEIGPPGSL